MKKINNLILISILIPGILSCNEEDINENDITNYLNEKENAYETLCKHAGLDVWNYYSDTTHVDMNQYKQDFSHFFQDEVLKRNVNLWFQNIDKIENSALKRRVELWNHVLTCAYVDFDPKIVELQSLLETQLSEYPSEKYTDEEIEQGIERLIELRNSKANELGYRNYAYMILQNTGIDTTWFEQLIYTIDCSTIESYQNIIAQIQKETVEYDDIREYIIEAYQVHEIPAIEDKDKEEILFKTLENIGIDLSQLPIQFTITDLPPGIGGFGNCIDIPNDFRAVAMQELSFRYLLHEIGHGLHWTNVRTESPILKGYEWCTGNLSDLYCEAMAETVAKFSQNNYWLKQNGYTEDQIDSLATQRQKVASVFLRSKIVHSLFEIELYKNPQKGAAEIKHELYKKYLLIDHDFSNRPNLIHLSYVSYPVYEQNYLIAEIISWQIHHLLAQKFGDGYAFNQVVGDFLRENFWKDGELMSWQDRLMDSTGSDLNVDGYLKSRLLN